MSKVVRSFADISANHMALANTAARITGTGMSFLLFMAMARMMNPEEFAGVAVILAWLALFIAFAGFSMPAVVLRSVAEALVHDRYSLARGVVVFAIVFTLSISVLVAGLILVTLDIGLMLLPVARASSVAIAALLLVPSVLLQVLAGLLQGLKRVLSVELLINTVRPALMLAGFGCLSWMHYAPLSAPMTLTAYLISTLLILISCAVYAILNLPEGMRTAKSTFAFRAWLMSAIGFMGVMIAAAINERIDVLMIGFVAPAAEVAVYAVAARFVQPVIAVAGAASVVMMPRFVECLAEPTDERRDEIHVLIRGAARTILGFSALALISLWLLAPWFLELFGQHYLSAFKPLMILLSGQVGAAIFGPAVAVAAFAGKARIATISLLVGIVTNALLNTMLVPQMGANGAALATALGSVAAAVIAWAWVGRRLGINTAAVAFWIRA